MQELLACVLEVCTLQESAVSPLIPGSLSRASSSIVFAAISRQNQEVTRADKKEVLMSQISAICLSDLHFGYKGSVLTAVKDGKTDINRTSPVLVSLVECLKSVLRDHDGEGNPVLVLAGDVLELSLATTNTAASVFAQFLNLLFDDPKLPLDRSVVYLPGNHDHHLWELAREQQYAKYLEEESTKLPLTNVPWHVTHLFPWKPELGVNNRNVGNLLLDTIAEKCTISPKVNFLTMYPNFGVLSKDKSRCTVIHHGHFTESIYHLMSELRRIVFPERDHPDQIWDVEAENYAWIEFLWGTLGRSAGVGDDVGLVYDMLQTPAGQSRLIKRLARNIPTGFNHGFWARIVETPLIYLVLRQLVKRFEKMERNVLGGPISLDTRKRIDQYIGVYVKGQLERECGPQMPDQLTFVFGHTHKPFEQLLTVSRVDRPVHIYNTGGWVVDTAGPAPRHGGAIVVIDDDGYTASIRMYNQLNDSEKYKVEVSRVEGDGNGINPLYGRLRELINPESRPWSEFSENVAKAVKERQKI